MHAELNLPIQRGYRCHAIYRFLLIGCLYEIFSESLDRHVTARRCLGSSVSESDDAPVVPRHVGLHPRRPARNNGVANRG